MLHIVLSHLNLSLSLKKKKKEKEKKKLGLVFPTFTSPSFPCLCFISGLILHGGHPISFTKKTHVSEVHKCNAQQSASISLFFSFFLFLRLPYSICQNASTVHKCICIIPTACWTSFPNRCWGCGCFGSFKPWSLWEQFSVAVQHDKVIRTRVEIPPHAQSNLTIKHIITVQLPCVWSK